MKYKIVVKTTNKNSHRVELCLDTWLKGKDYVCLTDRLTKKFNEVSGSEREDYHSAEEKTVFMINQIIDGHYNDYDWIAFIDDDAILNTKMFEAILPFLNKNYLYGLDMAGGAFKQDPNLSYPSGGCGYFISPQTAFGRKRMTSKNIGIEDASMGYWLRENNIPINTAVRLNGWFPFQEEYEKIYHTGIQAHHKDFGPKILDQVEDHNEKKQMILSCMTHHYIRTPELMNYIYDIFQEWVPNNLNEALNRINFFA